MQRITPSRSRTRLAVTLPILTALAACATTDVEPIDVPADIAQAGFDSATAEAVTTRERFLAEIAGRPLRLLAREIDAELVFGDDGRSSGMVDRGDGAARRVELTWEWVDDTYCREGSIGGETVERACEGVTLYPDIGVKLDYRDRDDPDEYWVFEET